MFFHDVKDLNWKRVKQLTSPVTSYDDIKCFTKNARTEMHPCVVVEIVLKWWCARTDKESVDMSFIQPLIITIQIVSSRWYYSVCFDERYKGLMTKLNIPEPIAARNMYYMDLAGITKCISEGDGKPLQLKDLKYTDNMKRYGESVAAFTYNADVYPPYGDTKHHWYIKAVGPNKHLSLIADSREEISNCINKAIGAELHFAPLPATLQ